MKKTIGLLCALSLVLSCLFVAGCGKSGDDKKPAGSKDVNPKEFFEKVWATYGEDDFFPMAGGDFDKQNMENPDVYDIDTYKDAFTGTFLVTEEMQAEITGDVITAMHMMNANTFSGAMFKVKDASKIASLAETYKSAVQGNLWMCGFPDTLVVLSNGDVMIVAFGEDSIVQTFKDKCTQADSDVKLIIEAPVLEG